MTYYPEGRLTKEVDDMSEIRKEIQDYIDIIPDSKLAALKPLLTMLADESIVIETDLTDEERNIITKGREEYTKGGFVSLDSIN